MLPWLLFLPGLLVLIYAAALGWLRQGLNRLDSSIRPRLADRNLPTLAICVAARNEAHNLPRLLTCLSALDYPQDKVEICIANDRSVDNTAALLDEAAARMPNLSSIHISEILPGFAPKKRALDAAIRATRGDILLLTDADCSPPPGWARAIVDCYQPGVALVAGYSPYRFDSDVPGLLRGLLQLDFFALAAVAAAGISRQIALTAAGTNLSYRRETFAAAGGFNAIRAWVSGDDDLFLHRVARLSLGRLGYAVRRDSFVPGAAPRSWRQFVHQRLRYASKGLHYSPGLTSGLIGVYAINLFSALTPAFAAAGAGSLALAAGLVWLLKSSAEFVFLHRAAALFDEKKLLLYFIPAALLHPFYISVFAVLGVSVRFRWKDGRTHRMRQEHDRPD